MLFPTGINPCAFTDTLPLGSSDTAEARFGAQQMLPITTVAPMGRMYLTFVVFAYPNANNAGPAGAPLVPIVEILTQPLGLAANPWQVLSQTEMSGNGSINLASSDQFVDYTYISLGAGIFQIAFQQNDAVFDNQAWSIRFTINDGVTSQIAQTGLTFTLDSTADTLTPWLALPVQPPPVPPAPISFFARDQLTLSGEVTPIRRLIEPGAQYDLTVPIGNYGTAALVVSDVSAPAAASQNGFSIGLLTNPVVVAPGSADLVSLQVVLQNPPSTNMLGGKTAPVTFTLASNDPLAASGADAAHSCDVTLFAAFTLPKMT